MVNMCLQTTCMGDDKPANHLLGYIMIVLWIEFWQVNFAMICQHLTTSAFWLSYKYTAQIIVYNKLMVSYSHFWPISVYGWTKSNLVWLYLRWFTHIFTEPQHVRFLILYEHAIVWIEYFPQQQQEELLDDWSTQYNTVISAF